MELDVKLEKKKKFYNPGFKYEKVAEFIASRSKGLRDDPKQ